ncbi:MAG: MOSC domain-containing protein [Acidimicrobiia bacterium]
MCEEGTIRGIDDLELGHILSVNVGQPRTFDLKGRQLRTSILREPVAGKVAVGPEGLEGNLQANLAVHGGVDKAVYAYASEDYSWWASELGLRLSVATFGENLTTVGVDVSGSLVGERWQVGSCVLEVAGPRVPCATLAIRMGDRSFPARFAAAGRPGAYLRVLEPGHLEAGDRIRRLERPSIGPSVAEVAGARVKGAGTTAKR